ncbi:hypothetical protein JZ751_001477 [Albula glossodonta]|uniref:Uncharacterized protein n=1 Tax=Albula glossodonta TaxID=121402 RepID=A0A8T2PTU7_9TELE|nr:hypothetical protein JZ751_001477 [Albula glossodonta]
MSGKIWRFSCCQKRKDRGRHLSRKKQRGKEMNGVSLQANDDSHETGRQTVRSERTNLRNSKSAQLEQTQATGQGDHIPDTNEDQTWSEFERKDFLSIEVDGSVVPPSAELKRAYQLIRQQLESTQREKHDLEAQVLQANQNVRDLRHEIAVLQKRLQVAENCLPNLPPPCPPPPPPPPPPAQPHVNPLRALLTIIQKRRNSRDTDMCPVQAMGSMSETPKDTEASHNYQCPGMNEVLEMIRNGVSLRHVIQAHKGTFRAEEDESAPGSTSVVPELQKILKKRKVSADKHVSDGSCDCSVEEEPSEEPTSHRLGVAWNDLAMKNSPRMCSPHKSHWGESRSQEIRGNDGELDGEQNDEDAGSTTSTLPLSSPLDQGQLDLICALPCPESPAPPRSADWLSVDNSNGHVQYGAGPTAARTSLKDQGLPDDNKVSTGSNLQPSCTPDFTDHGPVLQYLNWERWDGVDIKTALPIKPIFKSVSFMTSSGEKGAQRNQPNHRQEPASSEVVELDGSCPSYKSTDFAESIHDLTEDPHVQFVLLHDMLKPTLALSEGLADQDYSSFGKAISTPSPDALEESVDGQEADSSLPENQYVPKNPAFFNLDSSPPAICPTVQPKEVQFGIDKCRLPASSIIPVVEEVEI